MKLEDIRPGWYTLTKTLRDGFKGGDFGMVREFGNGVPFFDSNDNDGLVAVSELIEDGWAFTRLVPAQELERAYDEGRSDGLSRKNHSGWELSRAKRIAEGLE